MSREASSCEPVCILQGSSQHRDGMASMEEGADKGDVLPFVKING